MRGQVAVFSAFALSTGASKGWSLPRKRPRFFGSVITDAPEVARVTQAAGNAVCQLSSEAQEQERTSTLSRQTKEMVVQTPRISGRTRSRLRLVA